MNKEKSDFAKGFTTGQAKLAEMILSLELNTVADYEWILSHLKEVMARREVVSNIVIGFEKQE